MATIEGTRRFLRRAVDQGLLHAANARVLGRTNLECAAIGFGGYRIGGGPQQAKHKDAIHSALRAGVNLLDTSTHYTAFGEAPGGGHGTSEQLIGQAVQEAIAAGDVTREELILCSKVGHVRRGDTPPEHSVSVHSQGVGDDWHSIDPVFLEAEVRGSLERLGTPPDFILLHNPEYFLTAQMLQKVSIADAWDEMYERLAAAFTVLERLCDEGVISAGYGISGNFLSCSFSTTGRPNLYEALAVDRVTAAATSVRGKDHRLRLIQIPLNATEGGAVLGRGKVVPEASEGDCALANSLGLATITNRPLMSIPLPGIAAGDWGRQGASHIYLREKKPMGTVESLLKRALLESLSLEVPFQQAALRLALSGPSVSCTLCGARSTSYVEDISAVLREPPLATELVVRALEVTRSALLEVGGEKRRYW
mmetsp:Transcript_49317/g.78011  ORF Transcript_49317/g.78011 Transcript_49317/m.78011 type:complete len:423 (+) Transcript_49317:42-1310(+)|eukprot:CAMPEP_0169200992 /NCGR_PEP_ID=MMETSP1016-20121227/10166_1 /TAXON_ID=342587 /ORGANISM="Karlodinium micrum, Strain CCMP2283" /LENGTH=422 /DNA_ID=CAMNT_0009277881 /DNA_START=40 /DNA_END=1308 /DNA_ORIENTATION=+